MLMINDKLMHNLSGGDCQPGLSGGHGGQSPMKVDWEIRQPADTPGDSRFPVMPCLPLV